jgi:alpha-N-arabinofuranosidase
MSTTPATIWLDVRRKVAEISPLLFGGFAEHMGRCIYEGIYDPASPHADADGLRVDVLAALRELNFRVIRYPGGNFLSGYHWLDGVGPKAQRPRRRDLAWRSIETNQFGVNEFLNFARKVGTQPMLGVNMGTGTLEEAGALVEYVNGRAGSYYADLRAAHGYPEPYGVQYWCVGNEMDGPWQIGHLDVEEYGKKAREAAKIMRWHDPNLKLILCGSSSTNMPTYPEWDRKALELCYDQVDYLSLHYYAANRNEDTASYLAQAYQFEEHLNTLEGTLRYVKAKLRSKRDVYLSWDEWNVWYKAMNTDGAWSEAPHLIEEVYNLEDALVVAQWLNVFLRKCAVLKIACLAQIVNIIAPILTTRESLVKQTTFYPFLYFSRYASGNALDALVDAPLVETSQFGGVPALDVSASHDPASRASAVFIVNRSQTDTLPVNVVWQGPAPAAAGEVYQLNGADVKAANTFETPHTILPRRLQPGRVDGGKYSLAVPPLSFTVATFQD